MASEQDKKTDQQVCLDAVKAYMVKNGGDKKKLTAGTIDWKKVSEDANSYAEKAKSAAGGRRVLKRTNPGTGSALKNMHCCHLDVDAKRISLYTAAQTKTTGN